MKQASVKAPIHFPEIAPLRVAQRELVRELGLTRDLKPELGATFVQSHALIEIERSAGLTAGELAERLVIEQSTASRLVDRLIKNDWVRATIDQGDGRRKRLSLTPAGRQQVEKGHRRADREANGAMSLLTQAERETVLCGVQLYAKALRRHRQLKAVTVRPTDNEV